jgi:hypothetical protein
VRKAICDFLFFAFAFEMEKMFDFVMKKGCFGFNLGKLGCLGENEFSILL